MSEILSFFILTLGITYAIGLPIATALQGDLTINLPSALIFLARFGPLLTAVILTGQKLGWPRVRQLLAGLLRLRVAVVSYAIPLLIPTTISFISLLFYGMLTGN